jgi:hypothetical protein
MAKRKKAAKKKRTPTKAKSKPVKTVVTVSKQTTIGKPKRRTAGYYMKVAKDKLYDDLASQMIKKEKATKKAAKKKITKQISETRRKINKLK